MFLTPLSNFMLVRSMNFNSFELIIWLPFSILFRLAYFPISLGDD
jgi:hypothetical protein